jgi:hypothetical protein
MLQGQFRHALNVIGREQIIIEGIILTIQGTMPMQFILASPVIELNIAREGHLNIVLIPEECTRLNLVTIIK